MNKRSRYPLNLAAALLTFLVACSFAPLPFTVDLLERLADRAEGSVTFRTPEVKVDLAALLGEAREAGFSLPGLGLPLPGVTLPVPRFVLPPWGAHPLDFREVELPGRFEDASVDYRLRLEHGGNVGGELRAQLFLAPVRADAADQPGYALGGVQTFDLSEKEAIFENSLPLNAAQLQGIAEGRLRLALALEGELALIASGDTAFRYAFEALELTVRGLTAALDEHVPNDEGEVLGFADTELPGPGRVVGLGLDYALRLSHDSELAGYLTLQLYVAPPGEDSLWQDAYRFGTPQTLDLAAQAFDLSERAFLNETQLELLRARQLRVGLRLTGEPTVRLGEDVTLRYAFTKLLLRVRYAL